MASDEHVYDLRLAIEQLTEVADRLANGVSDLTNALEQMRTRMPAGNGEYKIGKRADATWVTPRR